MQLLTVKKTHDNLILLSGSSWAASWASCVEWFECRCSRRSRCRRRRYKCHISWWISALLMESVVPKRHIIPEQACRAYCLSRLEICLVSIWFGRTGMQILPIASRLQVFCSVLTFFWLLLNALIYSRRLQVSAIVSAIVSICCRSGYSAIVVEGDRKFLAAWAQAWPETTSKHLRIIRSSDLLLYHLVQSQMTLLDVTG